ncbi:MAG: hemin uptake protein HemP [Burkholderiales bacterium]|nr:hemin uptake protein HemP [Burkholderiales bacterium]
MNSDQPDALAKTMPTPSSFRSPVEPGQRTFPPGAIPTEFLFQGNQEILISHHGEHYRLRITKNGKLILTK